MEWMGYDGYEYSGSESEDSDSTEHSSQMDSDSDSEVTHAHAARAALLVARFAAAIQATKELQALHNRPRLLALEKLVLKRLDKGDAAFLNQKRIFRMMPPPLKAKINRELSSKWRHPPLVGELMDSLTRHLSLELEEPEPENRTELDGWSLDELKQLCDHVAREGKNSLRSLKINSHRSTAGSHPGLHLEQLSSLLLELRALTSLHLECNFGSCETDLLVSILASTNPDIRSLRLPNLSNKSLCTIADRWPQLEALHADPHEFDSFNLKAVLPRLRNLKKLEITFGETLFEVMMSLARAHDPASPPYILEEGFAFIPIKELLSSEDMVKLFTAFPALYWLDLRETDIPAVCAGLEGREHVHITELGVWTTSANPRALEPLLARLGRHVIKLCINFDDRFFESCVDLNMIGHYCLKLQDLQADIRELVSSEGYEVTETHFSKLKCCDLHQNNGGNGPSQLPTELVCRVLASPTLENFESEGVSITEEVVAALAAERGRGALSSLEKLTVWCPTPVSVEVWAELVSHAPRLRELYLEVMDEDDEGFYEMKGVLTSFVQQSELKASVCVRQW